MSSSSASDGQQAPEKLQDRVFAKVLQQMVPSDYSVEKYAEMTDKRKDKDRPQFSLTTMSGNFRRFNARWVLGKRWMDNSKLD